MGASILDLPGYETIDRNETETECHIRIKPKDGTLTVACPNCGVINEIAALIRKEMTNAIIYE